MDAERCPVVLEPTPHSYEVACSRCGQTGQVVVSVVERPADPIDAYLASPEAVEQLARAMRYHPDLRGKEGEYVEGWDAATRVALTVLRKVRADG